MMKSSIRCLLWGLPPVDSASGGQGQPVHVASPSPLPPHTHKIVGVDTRHKEENIEHRRVPCR